jgi:hypothetical protein
MLASVSSLLGASSSGGQPMQDEPAGRTIITASISKHSLETQLITTKLTSDCMELIWINNPNQYWF